MTLNSSRVRLEQENAAFAARIPAGSLVLDAGAGEAPYRHLFAHAQYESADFQMVAKSYATTTYVCDLRSIPVANGRFDYIVFNQVMEHLPDPLAVLRELWRVLRSGGELIYTGPLFYEEHEQPFDFYRYTQYGVRHLFTQAGFEITRLDRLEGFLGTVAYALETIARCLPARPSQFGLASPFLYLFRTLCRFAAPWFHRQELRHKVHTGFPKNYVALLRKP